MVTALRKKIFIGCWIIFQSGSLVSVAQRPVTFSSNKNNAGVIDSLVKSSSKSLQKNSLVNSQKNKIRSVESYRMPTLNQSALTKEAPSRFATSPELARYSQYEKQVNAARTTFSFVEKKPLSVLQDNPYFVRNSKYLRKYYDSIKRSPAVAQYKKAEALQKTPMKTVTQQQLLDSVNQKFRGTQGGVKDSLSKAATTVTQPVKSKIDLVHSQVDASRAQMPSLRNNIMKTKYLSKIDSARKSGLAKEHLLLKEKTSDYNSKVALVKRKERFLDKSYLEGILTLPQTNAKALQFSPAFAYHLHPQYSIGVGPNLLFNWQQSKTVTTLGARVFTKAEFFNRSFYVQVEDQMMPTSIDDRSFTSQKIYAGVGGLVPFIPPLNLNVALFYQFITNDKTQPQGSPWMFRIGISTSKKQK